MNHATTCLHADRSLRLTALSLSAILVTLVACTAPGASLTPGSSASATASASASAGSSSTDGSTDGPVATPAPTAGGPTATGGGPTATGAEPSLSGGPTPGAGLLERVSVATSLFVDGLDAPVALSNAGDGTGRLYVVQQAGQIVSVAADGTQAEQPFLDIAGRIVAGGEQGLLGLAFHPVYPTDDRFFVMYTAAGGGANTISEFHAPGGVGDPQSERVLLSIPDFAGNHNGGMVAFGPDGNLWIGTGDGGGGGDPQQNGQNTRALLGKILRLDVDSQPEGGLPYAIPADNPARQGTDAAPEVWAWGLRNPWRFSFDRGTGDLWIGDVGQNRWEEIDAVPSDEPGHNFGWHTMEGPDCYLSERCDQTDLTLPVASYEHRSGECTVIGGFVYRGEAVPEAHGLYLFADFCDGMLRGLDAAAAISGESGAVVDLLDADSSLSAFGEDEAGELYAVDLSGSVHRIVLSLSD